MANIGKGLRDAAERGDVKGIEDALKRAIDEKDDLGMTALIFSAANGHLEAVKYLVEKGAKIEEKDYNGITALVHAATKGQLEAVKYLVGKGAKIEEKDHNGMTALEFAERRHAAVADYLKTAMKEKEAQPKTKVKQRG